MPSAINITGQRFGRLVAVNAVRAKNIKLRAWLCKCDCGGEVVTMMGALRAGATTSCGCYRREATSKKMRTHGDSKSLLYGIWCEMRDRCDNPNAKSWKNYGGRGITVCDRWAAFEAFRDDMGHRPQGLTLDRVDNNGPYSPENCRWATRQEQARNLRKNVIVPYKGRPTLLLDACADSGVAYETVRSRLKQGWREDELFIPRHSRRA